MIIEISRYEIKETIQRIIEINPAITEIRIRAEFYRQTNSCFATKDDFKMFDDSIDQLILESKIFEVIFLKKNAVNCAIKEGVKIYLPTDYYKE